MNACIGHHYAISKETMCAHEKDVVIDIDILHEILGHVNVKKLKK